MKMDLREKSEGSNVSKIVGILKKEKCSMTQIIAHVFFKCQKTKEPNLDDSLTKSFKYQLDEILKKR